MIYVSTGGFNDKTPLEVSDYLRNTSIKGLELSSGKYTKNLENELESMKGNYNITLHNYFPVPKEPFVFNLASFNDDILKKSFEHAKRAIDLTCENQGKYYSFHAGYLLDPDASELGRKLSKKILNDTGLALDNFVRNVNELEKYARDKGVKLLIENNVLSSANFKSLGCNPFLMADFSETRYIFNKVNENVKLLVDVAHLKVSANTLGFDPVDYLKEFEDITAAYHISDNDGLEDSNQPFTENSWFIEHIRKDLDYYSLEIYSSDLKVLESQYLLMSEVLR